MSGSSGLMSSVPRCCMCAVALGGVAETPIRERERVVNDRRLRIVRERAFEHVRGARVILARERRPSETELGDDQPRLDGQRGDEVRLGRLRLALVEQRVAEPHERRHVGRLQRARPLERGRRLRRVALEAVHVAEVVRPAVLGRRQGLRVQQRRLRFVPELGRHQQHAHPAVRVAEIDGPDVPGVDAAGQGGIALAQLLLDRRRRVRQIRQREAAQVGRPRLRRARGRVRPMKTKNAKRKTQNGKPCPFLHLPSCVLMFDVPRSTF